VWLPKGNWYYFWDDKKYAGDSTQSIMAATGVVPVFVREGALVPMAPFAKSTFQIPKDVLVIHAYTGADGSFELYADDGVTEKFRTKNELEITALAYTQQDLGVEIAAAAGTYAGAPTARSYQVVYHGLSATAELYVNGTAIPSVANQSDIAANADGAVWDGAQNLLNVYLAPRPVAMRVKISTNAMDTGTGGAAGAGGTAAGTSGGSSGTAPGGGAPSVGGAAGSSPAAGGTSPSGGLGGATSAGGNSSSGSAGKPGTGGSAAVAAGGAPVAGSGTSGAHGDDSGSGCGCRTAGTRSSAGFPSVAALLVVLGLRRRRAQRRAS